MRSIDGVLGLLGGVVLLSSVALGVAAASVTQVAEPPLVATPQDECGPGSNPETGLQGRISSDDHDSGRGAEGFTCNSEAIGSFGVPSGLLPGTVGGYKVERYVDAAGHECAYYDSTLLFPLNATSLLDAEGGFGVNVLDMSDPAKPVRTDQLVSPAMLSPHESLVLSKERGLLAAVLGNPATNAGIIDVYDISEDCRHPVLLSSSPAGLLGHESGFAPDGRTFYSASPATNTIVAVSLDNPSLPVPLTVYNIPSHGLQISDDGNRAYVGAIGEGLVILDTSEVQARVPNPQIREIARLGWSSMSIPQTAIPVVIDGEPFVIEVDEFGAGSAVGAARIIDISDETQPHVVSNLRLEVHQPEHFNDVEGDPGTFSPIQGYAAHYCNVPQRIDPGIVACSMILSGVRIFDIRDPHAPREIAYFNAPVIDGSLEGLTAGSMQGSNYAMSSPAFAPERGEIWYSDGFQGLHVFRLTNDVWPFQPEEADESADPIVETEGAAPTPVQSDVARREIDQPREKLPRTGGDLPVWFVFTAGVGAALLAFGARVLRPGE